MTTVLAINHRLLDEHDYAIVDRALYSGPDLPSGLPLEPLVPAELESSAALMPGLVKLSDLPDPVRIACLSMLEQQANQRLPLLFGALLKSNAPLDRVQRHLCATLVAAAPGCRLYLRQFDPRVFVACQWLLDAQQLHRLFGPVDGWTVHLDGEWRTFSAPEAVSTGTKFRLSQAQAVQLQDLQLINEALTSVEHAGIDCRQQRTHDAYELAERARRHGLQRHRDIFQFVQHGLTLHQQFDAHPQFRQRLRRMDLADDLPYLAATADLQPSDMERIRNELTQGGHAS